MEINCFRTGFCLTIATLLFIPISLVSQVQVGNDLPGESEYDRFGFAVDISYDGNRVAVGAPWNDGDGQGGRHDVGHVRVFEFDGSRWSLLGQDIDGRSAPEQSGFSVSISGDGKRVASGAFDNAWFGSSTGQVRIYEHQNSEWIQVGQDINGEGGNNAAGYSISMSKMGDRIAIGAPRNSDVAHNSGQVRVYELQDSTWIQLGSDIEGVEDVELLGWTVSLSGDGTTLSIGSPFFGEDRGRVTTYLYSGSSWNLLGQELFGPNNGDFFGSQVSITSDGKRLAVQAFKLGSVRIYDFVDGIWSKVGRDVIWAPESPGYGHSVEISPSGNRFALGSLGARNISGAARMYEYARKDWIQVGEEIIGIKPGDRAGKVALSEYGERIALGAEDLGIAETGYAAGTGYVRVFDGILPVSTSGELPERESLLEIYPNPLANTSTIQFRLLTPSAVDITVFDLLGREIFRSSLGSMRAGKHSKAWNTETLESGTYLVRVRYGEGESQSSVVTKPR